MGHYRAYGITTNRTRAGSETYHVGCRWGTARRVVCFPAMEVVLAIDADSDLSARLQHFEQLVSLDQDADAYFDCLASLHKARLKYERILQTQPVPTVDQVGPRGDS